MHTKHGSQIETTRSTILYKESTSCQRLLTNDKFPTIAKSCCDTGKNGDEGIEAEIDNNEDEIGNLSNHSHSHSFLGV